MRILVATSNPHKFQEIQAVLAQLASADSPLISLLGLTEFGQAIPEPVEDGHTFEANAIKKARHYAQATGVPCLADDSGLEVDALNGEPGVYSARYAGISGPRSVVDPENNKRLLARLGDRPTHERTARFVCAMAWCLADRVEPIAVVRGIVEGRILLASEATDSNQPWLGRGINGFGYDPLFLITALNHTTAELPPEQKNAISHRGQATRLMWNHLVARAAQLGA